MSSTAAAVLNQGYKYLHWIKKWVAILLCITITADMVLQVFFRYVLNNSLRWSEELGVYLMIWFVFIGSSLLAENASHIRLSFLVRKLSWRLSNYIYWLTLLVQLIFLGFLVFYGIQVFNSGFHASSLSVGICTRWFKLAIPVGGGLMFIDTLFVLNRSIRDYFLEPQAVERHT